MRCKAVIMRIVPFAALLFWNSENAIGEPSGGTIGLTNVLLQSNDIVLFKKTFTSNWTKSLDAEKMPQGSPGIVQEIELHGVNASIHYGEFSSAEEARQATGYRVESVAGIFWPGLWECGRYELIGDETWFGRDTDTLAVLFRVGSICIQINCHDGSAYERERVAEILAERIVHKLGKIIHPKTSAPVLVDIPADATSVPGSVP